MCERSHVIGIAVVVVVRRLDQHQVEGLASLRDSAHCATFSTANPRAAFWFDCHPPLYGIASHTALSEPATQLQISLIHTWEKKRHIVAVFRQDVPPVHCQLPMSESAIAAIGRGGGHCARLVPAPRCPPRRAGGRRGTNKTVAVIARVPALAPFRIRSFRFQWPADLLASWAFEMEGVILGWFVLVSTGSVLALAVFGSLQFLGTLISPLFGMAGDRIGNRNLICLMRPPISPSRRSWRSCSWPVRRRPSPVFVAGRR